MEADFKRMWFLQWNMWGHKKYWISQLSYNLRIMECSSTWVNNSNARQTHGHMHGHKVQSGSKHGWFTLDWPYAGEGPGTLLLHWTQRWLPGTLGWLRRRNCPTSPWRHGCHRTPARPSQPGQRRGETYSAARCCDSWLREEGGRVVRWGGDTQWEGLKHGRLGHYRLMIQTNAFLFSNSSILYTHVGVKTVLWHWFHYHCIAWII